MPINLLFRDSLVKLFIPSGMTIVDIGADFGHMFGNRATNVDVRSIEEIKEEYAKSFNDELVVPNFVQSDAANLPFEDKKFDYAVLSEVLEHVEDPVKVVKEAMRVAYFVVISVPNEYEWASENKPFGPQSGHLRFFDEKMLMNLFIMAGLNVLEFVKLSYIGWGFFVILGTNSEVAGNLSSA